MFGHGTPPAHVVLTAVALTLLVSCKQEPKPQPAQPPPAPVSAALPEESKPQVKAAPSARAEPPPAATKPEPDPPQEPEPAAKGAPAAKAAPAAKPATATAKKSALTTRAPPAAPVKAPAEPKATPPAEPKAAPAKPKGTAAYNAILKQYCRGGRVDYAGIHGGAKQQLDDYVKYIGSRGLPGGRDAKLAFYINAYNAITIKMIVDRWPNIKSVMSVPGFFKAKRNRVAGRMLTLDQLENKVIRPTFKDARIHFALVCGARSCPPLRCAAFYGGGLQRTLEGLARRFINGRLGVRLDGDRVRVSKLFEWYGKDFVDAAGSVGKYLAKYHKTAADRLPTAKIEFQPYSWALNKK